MLALYSSSAPAIGNMAFQEYDNHKQLRNIKAAMFDDIIAESTAFSHLDHEYQNLVQDRDQSPPSRTDITGGDPRMAKKLNHNASERDRRRKLNSLYSSLRSLLPAADQMKKLSNPATVSRALRYVAELQRQVQGLIKKKEELLSRVWKKVNLICQDKQKKSSAWRASSVVSENRLSHREVVLHVWTFKAQETPLSHILLDLQEDGLSLLNATSHESFGDKIFYTLHLQDINFW